MLLPLVILWKPQRFNWRWNDLYFVCLKYLGSICSTNVAVSWTLKILPPGSQETTSSFPSLSHAVSISCNLAGNKAMPCVGRDEVLGSAPMVNLIKRYDFKWLAWRRDWDFIISFVKKINIVKITEEIYDSNGRNFAKGSRSKYLNDGRSYTRKHRTRKKSVD